MRSPVFITRDVFKIKKMVYVLAEIIAILKWKIEFLPGHSNQLSYLNNDYCNYSK